MSSKTRGSSAKHLRQGTLSFGSAKRTSVTQNTKATSQTKKSLLLRESAKNDNNEDVGDIQVPSSDDESSPTVAPKADERPTIKLKPSRARKQETQDVSSPGTVLQIKNTVDQKTSTAALPNLNPHDPKWRKHFAEVREKMGHMHPIHADDQNKIHQILRVFDMSYEYGPCVGINRLDRWERASALGLNPPPEVKDILTTRQGTEDRKLSQSVLFDEV